MIANLDRYREKAPPRQVAERRLAGIREGLNDVHADERSEAIWQAVKNNRYQTRLGWAGGISCRTAGGSSGQV
jgi:hypothetical protein